ncbi:MAG TPA: hypothetical protein VLG36_04350 [Candidatus Chromulinivoraceae bacterium]|nr:hypothetical protein [Candidatus Chromulinivoraceae bacterium]
MANSKNAAIKKEDSKASGVQKPKTNTSAKGGVSSKNKLLLAPLAIVLISCVYLFVQSPSLLSDIGAILFSPSFLAILITPSLPMLLIAIFCCLAIYLLLTARRIGRFATVVTWLFAAVAVCFLFAAVPGIEQMCGELSCATTNTFSLGALLLMNPFADLLWSVLATVGIVLLVRKLK